MAGGIPVPSAEFAHELIRDRNGESSPRQARGVKLGRRPKLTPLQKREAVERRERGDETHAEIVPEWRLSGCDLVARDRRAHPYIRAIFTY